MQNGFPSQSRGEPACTTNNLGGSSNPTQSYESHQPGNFDQSAEQSFQTMSKQPTILQPGNLPPSFFQNSQLQMPQMPQMPQLQSQFQFPNMQSGQFPGSAMLKPPTMQNMMPPQANFPNMGLNQGFNQNFNFPNMNQMPNKFAMNKNFFNNNNGFFGF